MTSATPTKKKRSIASHIFIGVGILLSLGGLLIIYLTVFHEQKATALYGDIKLYTADVIRENGGTPPGEQTDGNGLTIIRLEGEGGQRELDWCTGAFVHMLAYHDKNELPPVWSAHNGCGGHAILNWDIGSHFMVGEQEYEVIDFRTAPQRGGTTDDIAGIQGEFVLQSCSYDGYTMYFMGAKKVKSPAEIKAEEVAAEKAKKDAEKAATEKASEPAETPPVETQPVEPPPAEEEMTPGVSSG